MSFKIGDVVKYKFNGLRLNTNRKIVKTPIIAKVVNVTGNSGNYVTIQFEDGRTLTCYSWNLLHYDNERKK